jgi:hypothetical protein
MKTIALLFLWMCGLAFADDPPLIPENLVQVKSGGHWRDGDREGFVRFSAFERGFDNVRHQVVIEWIQSPTSSKDKPNVVSRVVIDEIPDIWSIGEATFVVEDGNISISLEATNSYMPDKNTKITLKIQGLDKVEVSGTE